ncbi:MAG: LamG-like jellyroll fold domain-containing protein, partial [Limisphaerales bacterium]
YYASTNVWHDQPGIDGDSSAMFSGGNTAFAIVPTTDNRISLPPRGPFTVECWVRAAGTLGYRGLVSQTGPSQNGINNSANGSGWEISINYAAYRFTTAPNSPRVWSFHVFNGVSGQTGGAEAETVNTNWLTSSIDGYTNAWVYLCGVFDGTNCWLYEYSTNMDNATYGGTNQMNLQFPINTAAGAPYGGPPDTSITNAQFSPDTWDPLQIGAERGIGANFWHGNIDEVAIYTNALTPDQITNHYSAGVSGLGNYSATILADNPVMYWRMDAPTWTPVLNGLPSAANYGSAASSMTNLNMGGSGADASVYQPGTVPGVPGPSYSAFGPFTNACAFNGLAGAVDAGYNPLLDPTGATNNFSLVAWFKGNPMDAGRWEVLASHSDKSWKAQINTGTAYAFKGAGGQPTIAPARYNVNDGQWHMYALESTPSSVTLYIDAAYVATLANSSYIPGNTNVDAWIGGAPDYAQPTNHATYNTGQQYFAGEICHVAYFTNALTPDQINSLYSLINPQLVLGTEPVSGSANAGDTFTFLVGASGQQLAYQWYKDNVPIPNQTNSALVLDPVQVSDASTNYYIVITNSYGAVTSAPPVSLTVYSTPIFSQVFPITYTNPMTLYGGQTVDGTNYLGSTPAFSVRSVLGVKPVTYQWLTNGVPVDGANGTNFTFANCQLDSPTNFSCVVSNSYGEATNTWSVSYLPAPMAPFPQAVLAANPITYWRLNEPDDQNYDGNNGAVCNDYQSGNNGIYTNVYLSNFTLGTGYSPTTDPDENAAEFGIYKNSSSLAGLIGNVDFTTPAGSHGEFTVAVWVNGNATTQVGNAGIVTKGVWGGEQFTLDEGAGGPSLRWVVRTPANYYAANSTKNLNSDSTWHYVVGVCDQVNGKIYLYIDGNLAASGAIPAGAGILPSTEPVAIGSRKNSSGSYAEQFKGFLNDAAIYNYAMTPAQIVSQYAAVGGTNAPYFFPSAPAAHAGAAINTTLTIPAIAIGTPPMGYVWTNLTTGATVSGGVTNGNTLDATLAYNNVPAAWNGNQLQLIVTNAYGTISASIALSITNTVNLNLTNIVFSASSGNLTLSWPPDHTGWTLQAQTNNLSVGISTNWVDVANSSTTNQVIIPTNLTNGSVFYRLIYRQ